MWECRDRESILWPAGIRPSVGRAMERLSRATAVYAKFGSIGDANLASMRPGRPITRLVAESRASDAVALPQIARNVVRPLPVANLVVALPGA